MGSISIRCLETPFHTLGHICYLCSEEGSPERNIFTGDTLFIGGCGRCFAGTPQQMYTSLIDTLARLPADVKVRATLLRSGHVQFKCIMVTLVKTCKT